MTAGPIKLIRNGIETFTGLADPAPGGGSQPVQFARLKLTDAQIKALPTTPIQLVAAPVAGKMLWPLMVLWLCDTTAAAYSNFSNGGTLGVYHAGEGAGTLVNYLTTGTNVASISNLLGNGAPASAVSSGLAATDFTPNMAGDVASIVNPDFSPTLTGAGQPWESLALVVGASNVDGDYQDGNPANSLVVAVIYATVDL